MGPVPKAKAKREPCGMLFYGSFKNEIRRHLKSGYYSVRESLDAFPRNIHFAITNRCNLSCSFCGQDKDRWSKDEELALSDYKDLIDQIAHMGRRTASFSGGEIFVRSDMVDILCYAKKRDVPISTILTNGTLLDEERIQVLVDGDPGYLGFSIDGIESVHDEVRGVKGSYRKTVSAIRRINEIKKARGRTRPAVGVNFVVTKETMDSMEEVVAEMAEMGLSLLRFQYLTYITPEKLAEHKEFLERMCSGFSDCYWDRFKNDCGKIDTSALVRTIRAVKKKASDLGLKVCFSYDLKEDEIRSWYDNSNIVLNRCNFLQNLLVLPNGDVPLCDFVRIPVGNVREKTLREIWREDKAREFRRTVRRRLLPGCERCCQLRR